MSHASPAFAFSRPVEPQALATARSLAAGISADQAISRAALNTAMREHFGGSDAQGRWSARDAHAALELAQVLFLQDQPELVTTVSPELAARTFAHLEALVPSQTTRSDEQMDWQQFATPPRIAWLAARACQISAEELVLEPSAGTGMLAVWAAKAGARLALNEISPLRRECLGTLFPAARVTALDGELIDELLDPLVAPSVVLMNPPYSHGIERGHDGRTGARHLRSAWKQLLPGGRLVAVMPDWFDLARFLAGIAGPVALRLNATVERGFVKQGTSITTRLLVLDKVDGGDSPMIAKPANFAELCLLVEMLPDRAARIPEPIIAARPALPLRLVASARKPVPLALRPVAAAPSILPLAYQPLEAPAPISEQIGHYLPYRPSRIAIHGAVEHPTPLVESVAMGSITAPVPEAVPQLPSGVVGNGILSVAQPETLI